MVSKFKPGIPDNFTFDVAPVTDLGDYLDESRSAPALAKREREAPVPSWQEAAPTPPVRSAVQAIGAARPAPPRESTVAVNADTAVHSLTTAPLRASTQAEELRARVPRHTGPRREINMTPETSRMSDELLEMIRGGSGQRDTKASEMFHALVLLVHELKDDLDLHTIPKRGRWGSPTARAYPVELKNVFQRALIGKHIRS